jgi:predicted  nucleic acid-binding Zn-ribbon protein
MQDSTNKAESQSVKQLAKEARQIAERRQNAANNKNTTADSTDTLMQGNKIALIMLDQNLSPEHKRDQVISALTFSKELSREENRAKLEEFEKFKEYLQEQRKILNKEGIKLQDTEAFAELQAVIDAMTEKSIEFQESVNPLLEVLNAVFEIRKKDKITDVYKEIQNDKIWAEEQNRILEKLQQDLQSHKTAIDSLEREKARLMEDRSLFGLGPLKKSAKERVAEIEQVDFVESRKRVEESIHQIQNQQQVLAEGRGSENPELKKQKEVLRGFLDLTKDVNRARQKALIDSAVRYVETSDVRLKGVIDTLQRLEKHSDVVNDVNGMLKNVHIVMDDALKVVAKNNSAIKEALLKGTEDESSIARMTREEKLNDIHEYITLADDGAVDITTSIGGLTKQSVQIQSYRETLRNEKASTRRLHLEGVSQMGEQLMSVISAISAAATTESRSVAANNFAKMSEQNQKIISQEVIKNATNIELEAAQISKLVGELQDYGEVLNASSEIATHGYGKMRETVDAIRKVSGSVQGAINDLLADRADAGFAAGNGESKDHPAKEILPKPGFNNPFDKLKK